MSDPQKLAHALREIQAEREELDRLTAAEAAILHAAAERLEYLEDRAECSHDGRELRMSLLDGLVTGASPSVLDAMAEYLQARASLQRQGVSP